VGLEGSGLRVLDLGCGTGRDCYVCAALVGEKGFVTGGWGPGFCDRSVDRWLDQGFVAVAGGWDQGLCACLYLFGY